MKKLAESEGFSQNSRMDEILKELKHKMRELETLKKNASKENLKKISAQKTRQMLEEIVVPPLELIKEPKAPLRSKKKH